MALPALPPPPTPTWDQRFYVKHQSSALSLSGPGAYQEREYGWGGGRAAANGDIYQKASRSPV